MARIQNTSARNTRMETLEDRQMFSTYGTINLAPTDLRPSALIDYTRNGAAEMFSAGQFDWARSAANPGTYAGKATTLETYCIEPDQDMTTPTIGYTVADLANTSCHATAGPLSAKKADQVRELWGRFHSQVGTDNTKAAAFQMAIWEIVCDGDRNLSTGSMQMNGTTANDVAVKAQAQCWLDRITGCGPKADLLALTSPTDQDQIFEKPCTPCKPSEPSAYHPKGESDDVYKCILKDIENCLTKYNTTYSGGFHFTGSCPTFTVKASGSDCGTISLCGNRS